MSRCVTNETFYPNVLRACWFFSSCLDVDIPWALFGDTRMALDHSLTHSILINLFIEVKLNTLHLPSLLSITFVPSAFYAWVCHLLEAGY